MNVMYPIISSSVTPFSSCPQSFPASGSFPMNRPFTSGGQKLELQLQHQCFQWIFRVDSIWDWLVWSPCSPRDSQESSPAPQLKRNGKPYSKFKVIRNCPPLHLRESWKCLCLKNPLSSLSQSLNLSLHFWSCSLHWITVLLWNEVFVYLRYLRPLSEAWNITIPFHWLVDSLAIILL